MKSIPLGIITDIKTGKLDVNAGAEDGKYPFFTCASTPYKINEYAFDTEAVLIAGNGDLNVKYYQGKFNAYQRTYVIQNKDKEKLSMKYLYYFIETYMDRLRRDAIGGIIKYIKIGHLTDAEIPLPSLDGQIRIAHLLGKVEGLIAQRKQHLQQLDDLLKSVFLEMFGDPVRNEKGWEPGTSQIYAEMVTVGVVVKPASHYVERGVIALRSLNIKPNRLDLSDLVYFSQKSNDGVLSKSRLKANDVVVVRTGKTGTAAVIPASLDGANCIDLIIVRPKRAKIHPEFLTCLLNSERGMALVSSLEVGGIQKHFNVGALNKIPFPLPPIELQNQFAALVEKVEGIKSNYQHSLTNIEALYGALSQKAFKGKLDLSCVPLPAKPVEGATN